jgi:hypothetical protein
MVALHECLLVVSTALAVCSSINIRPEIQFHDFSVDRVDTVCVAIASDLSRVLLTILACSSLTVFQHITMVHELLVSVCRLDFVWHCQRRLTVFSVVRDRSNSSY